MKPDFGKTSVDYAKYRAGFPPSFFQRMKQCGVGLSGQRILDLGTGTGTLARAFARGGASVTGIDAAPNQIAAAEELDRLSETRVQYRVGRAEALEFPAESFDVAVAGQCWHWFDGKLVFAELKRVLRMRGRVVICHFDWLPVPGNVVEATERLIESHNPDWKLGHGDGYYPQWAVDAGRAGFRDLEVFTYEHDQLYTHESWRGRVRASAGVGGSLKPDAVALFDRELAAILRERFAHEPLHVPHRVFALLARRPE
jgi:SAM-dependent methyltransferase